jgi:hypothetical protein
MRKAKASRAYLGGCAEGFVEDLTTKANGAKLLAKRSRSFACIKFVPTTCKPLFVVRRVHRMQVYVQDLIQANGAKLWPLFEAGAVVYVCGDARRMVRAALAASTQHQGCLESNQFTPNCILFFIFTASPCMQFLRPAIMPGMQQQQQQQQQYYW